MTTANAQPPAVKKAQAITDRHLYRMGVVGGSVGAVVALPFVALHPHLPPGDASGVLKTVLDFPAWLFLHFGLMMVLVLMLAGMAAFSRSIQDDRASAWATAAFVIGLIGTIFAILGQGVDGLGLNVAAHVWLSTPDDQKFAAVTAAAGVMGVATGIFILVLFFYFGLTSLVYALAFGLSEEFPTWLAGIAFLGGSLGFSAALFTYFSDFSDPVYFGLFIPSAVVFLIWMFVASIILWRRELRVPKDGSELDKEARRAAKATAKAKRVKAGAAAESPAGVKEPAVSGPTGRADTDLTA